MAELNFKSWCFTQGLTESTVQMLEDKGITNLDTLRLVTQPLLDSELKTSNLEQNLVLREVIHKLWLPPSDSTNEAHKDGSSGQLLNESPPRYNTRTPATELHQEKHIKNRVEEEVPVSAHGEEFVHANPAVDDETATEPPKRHGINTDSKVNDNVALATVKDGRIKVATEEHWLNQPKGKRTFSYHNPYIKTMMRLTWLSSFFSSGLFATTLAGILYQTSNWLYFNGVWGCLLITSAAYFDYKLKDNPLRSNRTVERYFTIMSVLLHLGLVSCIPMMGIAIYGMYLDREIHIYGLSCDNVLIRRLQIKCEHNETDGTTYSYVVGWNARQAIHTANIVLAYVVFIIVLWALYARYDFINWRQPVTFKDASEKRFIYTSFIFRLTPISFPLLSAVAVVFKIALWESFTPALSGCILLVTGFHAHHLYFLPEGAQKKKRHRVQFVLLILSMLLCTVTVIVHTIGIFQDNEIHDFGVSCDEDYIRYFNYTCEVDEIDGELTTHAYLTGDKMNYKQWIHVGIITLGLLHIVCLLFAIVAGRAFLKKHTEIPEENSLQEDRTQI